MISLSLKSTGTAPSLSCWLPHCKDAGHLSLPLATLCSWSRACCPTYTPSQAVSGPLVFSTSFCVTGLHVSNHKPPLNSFSKHPWEASSPPGGPGSSSFHTLSKTTCHPPPGRDPLLHLWSLALVSSITHPVPQAELLQGPLHPAR